MPHPFSSVDSQPDPMIWIDALDLVRRHPFYVRYKERVIELLAPLSGKRYLEVGTGTGADAIAARSAGACVVGVDSSVTMVAEANRRGLRSAVAADAHALPFADGTFAGYWADRTYQHLADPETALSEARRAVEPGGRVVVVDPDYSTQEFPFPDPELARKVLLYRQRHAVRNGDLGPRMVPMMERAGLDGVVCEELRLTVEDPHDLDRCLGLRTWARAACGYGLMSSHEVDRWLSLFDEVASSGRFSWSVSFFITSGVVRRAG